MPSATQTVPEVAADVLAAAVEKAVKLERERSGREMKLAVEKARQEAKVEHRLDGHDEHLAAINGSIAKTGNSLDVLTKSVDDFHTEQAKINTEQETREKEHWKTKGIAYSKKQASFAYATIAVMAAVPFIAEVIKLIWG